MSLFRVPATAKGPFGEPFPAIPFAPTADDCRPGWTFKKDGDHFFVVAPDATDAELDQVIAAGGTVVRRSTTAQRARAIADRAAIVTRREAAREAGRAVVKP